MKTRTKYDSSYAILKFSGQNMAHSKSSTNIQSMNETLDIIWIVMIVVEVKIVNNE